MLENFDTTMFNDGLIPEDLRLKLIDYLNNKNWLTFNKLIKQVYPSVIKNYIKKDSFIIPYNENEEHEIKIKYDKLQNEYPNFAYLEFEQTSINHKITNVTILDIHISAPMILLPKRCIDATLAHELAHAKRFLEKRYKTKLLKRDTLNQIHEEYWADREVKKMLPIVNPKYNNKNERRKTLLTRNIVCPRGKAAGIASAFGKLTDIVVPFSKNSRIIHSTNLENFDTNYLNRIK